MCIDNNPSEFLKELNINVNFIKASDNEYVGKGSNLILDMCKKLKAKTFIFENVPKFLGSVKKS